MSADLDLSQFEGMTPGPWGWFGNAKHNSIYLAAKHSGRKFVMQFKRWGMGGAQPYFQPGSKGMVPASSLVKFEVGDVGVKGVDEAKQNATVYRFDITGIDCPDARAIAAVPALIAEVKRLREGKRISDELHTQAADKIDELRARIAELERDRERLDWLIKQGPPGAAEGIGLNEDA